MINLKKLIQICDYLLSLNNGILNYTKLIKLIYIANREMLKTQNDLIINDRFVSMPQGPVLSSLYNLILEKYTDNEITQLEWNQYFFKNGYNLKKQNFKSNFDELALSEINILKETDEKFKTWTWKQIVDNYLHKKDICPEWVDPNGSSYDIYISDILMGLGYDDIEAAEIQDEISTYEKEEALFAKMI